MQTFTPLSSISSTRVCPPPPRITLRAVLQHRIIEGIGDHIHLRPPQDADQLGGVVIVVVVHRRGMAGRNPPLPAAHDGLPGHNLHET